MKRDFLSVVIPAYNEEKRLPDTLRKIRQYLPGMFGDFEIIVVDDGSSDSTADIANAVAAKLGNISLLRNEGNMGKGYSVRRGVLASKGPLVLLSDADLSTPIEEVEKMLSFIDGGAKVVIGSRGMRESELRIRQPWYRERMGKTFNLIVRLLILGGISDTQCGFKLFDGDTARRIFGLCRIDGFGFDVEALFLARKLGIGINEVPVRWLNSPDSRVRIFRDSSAMILEILKIKALWISGAYKIK